MASLRNTSIATRVALVVAGIHAVLLPALYAGLAMVVSDSHANLFVQHVRTFSRNLVEEIEIGNMLESRQRLTEVLDLALLNGEGVYAELIDNGQSIGSGLNAAQVHWPGRQDFAFGDNGDHIYFIALPVARPGHSAELRLGFDERPTADQVRLAMRHTQVALGVYLLVALVAAVAFGLRLARPVVHLARTARRIAAGNYVQSLRLGTGIRELHALGDDLEQMRGALVGINERLRAEMAERERADAHRRELERRLQHRHRIETVGTLAGGIAHEINNALLPIMLLAETALDEAPADSPLRADLEQILASARHAKEIVAKVLLFSRAPRAAGLVRIDLQAVLREALRLFALLVPSTVEIRADIDAPVPAVLGDAALATQLVMNLCTNAYQALAGRAGTLTVGLHTVRAQTAEAEPGEVVALTVADTGHGMSAATRERIFEPFFTTREVGAGSGLGLAVVHGIVEAFGASIDVESAVGRGSTFTVQFPVAAENSVTALEAGDTT